MSDGLATLLGLFYGITAGPSNAGNRADGKICTAQPGECRHNSRYYTLGMKDTKSWSNPCAGDECRAACPYLSSVPRDMGDEPTRRKRADDLVSRVAKKRESDKLTTSLLLGSLGLDPRECVD